MTQPGNSGGQPAGDRSPDDQDAGSPPSAPPPGSWHFPPEPAGPAAAPAQPGSGTQGPPSAAIQPDQAQPRPGTGWPYGTPAGTSPPYVAQPYGAAQSQPVSPHPAQGQPYGTPPPPGGPAPGTQPAYGTPPYGTPVEYGMPPPPGGPAPGTQPAYGTPPYSTSQQYARPYAAPYPPYGAAGQAGREPGLAEWWRRLLGRIIDVVVLSVLAAPIAFALLSHPLTRYQQTINRYPDLSAPGAQAAISKADGRLFGAWLVFAAIVAVISFVYDSIQHGLWGQTLGKRALGTRVVSGYDRSKISGGTAAGRAAVYSLIPVIPLAGSVFWLLDALWLTWDRRRQCLHDKAARTIVVKTSFHPAGQQPGHPW